ncbi:NAD(P)H-dependent oxidoreductase subunit E [Paenalcaligenes hominis]|uniref:NAD(P)H-dependent oxidoreductase subunit E n=1 Tax=Paenalcaligenes hominis TaxID=643674 RepID=UPI0035254B7E
MSIPVPALTAEQLATVLQNALDQHAHKEGNLLPLLHSIQDQLRYIPAAIVPLLSTAINRSRAEIHGVISFYTHFRTQPPAPVLLELCRAESCQARGANHLITQVKEQLGCDFHQTSSNGHVSLEPVYCLGLCSQGPAAMINGTPVAHLNLQTLNQELQEKGVQS